MGSAEPVPGESFSAKRDPRAGRRCQPAISVTRVKPALIAASDEEIASIRTALALLLVQAANTGPSLNNGSSASAHRVDPPSET